MTFATELPVRNDYAFNVLAIREMSDPLPKGAISSGLTMVTIVDRPLESNQTALASIDQVVFRAERQAIGHARDWCLNKLSDQVATTYESETDGEALVDLLFPMVEEIGISKHHLADRLKACMSDTDDPCYGLESALKQALAGASREQTLIFIDEALAFFEDDLTEVRIEIAPVVVSDSDQASLPDWFADDLEQWLTVAVASAKGVDTEAAASTLSSILTDLEADVTEVVSLEGLESQLQSLLMAESLGSRDAALAAIIGHVNASLEVVMTQEDFAVWRDQRREVLLDLIIDSGVDARRQQAYDTDELAMQVRLDVGLDDASYITVKDKACDLGLLDS